MEQLNLLTSGVTGPDTMPALQMTAASPLVDLPRARNVDPETSHQAAALIKWTGKLCHQQLQALALVKIWPGLTTWELAEKVSHGTSTTPESQERWLSRRLPDLNGVHVCKGEPRTVKGRKATTWWPK